MRSIWARKEGQTKGMDGERGEYSVFVHGEADGAEVCTDSYGEFKSCRTSAHSFLT